MNWSPLLPADATPREPGPPQLHTSGEDGSMKCPEGAGDPSGALQACYPTGSTGQVLGTPDVCLSVSGRRGCRFPPRCPTSEVTCSCKGQFWARCQRYLQGLCPSAFGLGAPLGHSPLERGRVGSVDDHPAFHFAQLFGGSRPGPPRRPSPPAQHRRPPSASLPSPPPLLC